MSEQDRILAAHNCAWKDAIIDAAVVDWVYCKEHETDPRKAVNDLLAWQAQIALDPAVSKEAANLHQRIAAAEAARDAAVAAQADAERSREHALEQWRRTADINAALHADRARLREALKDALTAMKRAELAIHSEYCGRNDHPECAAIADSIGELEAELR